MEWHKTIDVDEVEPGFQPGTERERKCALRIPENKQCRAQGTESERKFKFRSPGIGCDTTTPARPGFRWARSVVPLLHCQ